jgi:hypothetical protein
MFKGSSSTRQWWGLFQKPVCGRAFLFVRQLAGAVQNQHRRFSDHEAGENEKRARRHQVVILAVIGKFESRSVSGKGLNNSGLTWRASWAKLNAS